MDSNVLLDLATADPRWSAWSIHALTAASLRGPLFINDIVYAEISGRFAEVEALDRFLEQGEIRLAAMPRPALFLAARAHARYRARGGTRTGVLADFLIGALAVVEGWPLLTRDVARYRQDFPEVRLIAP